VKVRTTPPVSIRPDPPSPAGMPDVQSSSDARRVAIDRVGVKDVTYPIRLKTPGGGEQTTVASVNLYVSLPHHQKGTHMSRFLEVLNEYAAGEDGANALTPACFPKVAKAVCERLNAREAHVSAEFTYFIRKLAPVTKAPGLMDYRVRFESVGRAGAVGGAGVDGDRTAEEDFVMTVAAPATSLCPCSKEISRYGAHNQRCRIEAQVRIRERVWIEEVVAYLERAASTEVFAVLKRPDEKWVTERAYENPKFVEDIVRDLALLLDGDDRITWYSINSENFESIHNHNAYAQLTRDKRAGGET
jgi:GTP cyclohydrolase I